MPIGSKNVESVPSAPSEAPSSERPVWKEPIFWRGAAWGSILGGTILLALGVDAGIWPLILFGCAVIVAGGTCLFVEALAYLKLVAQSDDAVIRLHRAAGGELNRARPGGDADALGLSKLVPRIVFHNNRSQNT